MHGEIGIVAVRTATILHVSSPSFFSRYMQYTVSIAQNPASVKGERRFSARQCQRHRPPCPFLQRLRFFARRPLLPAGEKQDAAYGNLHKCLPVRSEPAFSALFSRSRVAFCPRLMQVFREAFLQKGRHPRRSALSAAPPILCATRAAAPSRPPCIHAPAASMAPPAWPYACPRRLRRRPPFVPPRARARPAHRLSPPAVSAAGTGGAADTAPAWAPCGANTAGSLRRKAA